MPVDYNDSDAQGKIGVDLFIKFLNHKNISWSPVPLLTKGAYDIMTYDKATYEIKYQKVADDNCIAVEEIGDMQKPGWYYKSQADWLIVIGWTTHNMFKLKFNDLRKWYDKTRLNYTLLKNEESNGKYNQKWISRYRIVPVSHMISYFDIKKYNIEQEST